MATANGHVMVSNIPSFESPEILESEIDTILLFAEPEKLHKFLREKLQELLRKKRILEQDLSLEPSLKIAMENQILQEALSLKSLLKIAMENLNGQISRSGHLFLEMLGQRRKKEATEERMKMELAYCTVGMYVDMMLRLSDEEP